jgi:propanol-preferring alcohol dehydrogenase
VAKGGTVVCGGIHMTDVPSFPYEILWGERVVRSVANLTRRDGEEFLALAPKVPVRTEVQTFPLAEADEALRRLRAGRMRGAAVLVTGDGTRTESTRIERP